MPIVVKIEMAAQSARKPRISASPGRGRRVSDRAGCPTRPIALTVSREVATPMLLLI
jgi:hypothetical protein